MASNISESLRRNNAVSILTNNSCNDDGVNTSDTIVPQAAGVTISWASVCAKTINAHGGNDNRIITLSGDAIEWSAAKPEDYFLISTNTDNCTAWQRLNTTTLSTDQ